MITIGRIQETKNIVRRLMEVPTIRRMELQRTVMEWHRTVWFEFGTENDRLYILGIEWTICAAE